MEFDRLRIVVLSALLMLVAQCCWLDRAHAQPAQSARRIAVVLLGLPQQSREVQALREGLREAGYVEGRDVVLEWRSAEGNYAGVPSLVADVVRSNPDVIVVEGTVAARAAKDATTTIPIVIAVAADPVGSGIVDSLAQPGGNVTGLSTMITELGTKRLQFLKQAIPGLKRIGILRNPSLPWHLKAVEDLRASAKSMSVELTVVSAQQPAEFEGAFATLHRGHVQALYLLDDPFFASHAADVLDRAAKARIAVMGAQRRWVREGALLSYSVDFADMFWRSAFYVDKILKGAKPGDLPVEQPTKFELVVNLKTAKRLGLTIPESVLTQASEVIQ